MPAHLPTSISTFPLSSAARHRHSGLAGTSALSIWLSVDPMADKYPGVSPYVYCADNPVVIKDEDGEDIIGAFIGGIVGVAKEIISQTISNGMENLSNGKGFFKEWGMRIDWIDVGISAAVGTLDGFVPGSGHLAGELVGDIAKASFDWKSGNKQKNGTGWQVIGYNKEWADFANDLVVNFASTGLSHASGLGKIKFERQSFHIVDIMYETAIKGTFSGMIGACGKMGRWNQSSKRNTHNQKESINFGPLKFIGIGD